MNEVDSLLQIDFLSLKYEYQMEIIKMGPHQPSTFEHQQIDRAQKRTFSSVWFEKVPWLTVSLSKKTFYCFYCLIFGGGDIPWCTNGYKDLKHLSERMKKHENSVVHINNAVKFKTFGVAKSQLDNVVSVQINNKNVRKNRQVLNNLIESIKFCCFNTLPLFGNTAPQSTSLQLISYLTDMDRSLDVKSKGILLGKLSLPKPMGELLDSMYAIYKQEVKKEIEHTKFVSLMVEEVRSISNTVQYVLILRFVKNGMPTERFHSFVESSSINAMDLLQILHNEVTDPTKLIAHTYEALCQERMDEMYPRSHFIDCYSNKMSTSLVRICSKIANLQEFFVNASGFSTFFSASSKHLELLRNERNQNKESKDREWHFQQGDLNWVYENQVEILTCLEKIQKEQGWSDYSVAESTRIANLINDEEFYFFLDFFCNVLHQAEIFYQSLLRPFEDSYQALQEFESEMDALRENIDCVDDEDSEEDGEPKSKRLKNNEAERKVAATDAWQLVVTYMKQLYEAMEYTATFCVIEPRNFQKFKESFPNEQVQKLTKIYPIFNKTKLSIELGVLYNNDALASAKHVCDLLRLLKASDLLSSFTEVSVLLEMILTTPVPTEEPERRFETIQKVTTMLQNSDCKHISNPLAVLYVHQDVITNLQDFNKMVINRFSLDNEIPEYLYK